MPDAWLEDDYDSIVAVRRSVQLPRERGRLDEKPEYNHDANCRMLRGKKGGQKTYLCFEGLWNKYGMVQAPKRG